VPRIRTIKPDFFTSDTVSTLPLRARLTWIGLWTHCDDHGRCRDNVKLIKAAVWPLDDVSLRDIESDLDDLVEANVVFRYVVEGKAYLQVTNWAEHQKVDRPSKSNIPAPTEAADIHRAEAEVTAGQTPRDTLARARESASRARDRKGRERKGKEGDARASAGPGPEPPPEPPLRCDEHTGRSDSPPCGACADLRRAREQWKRDNVARLVAAPRCDLHAGQVAGNCSLCRSEQLGAAS
jgi:hypothetical protein